MKQQSGVINKIQTPLGMVLVILGLIIVSIGIGLAFVFAYKHLSINDSFAQGSGSLIQAIWGSAATIAASILAIILATEALRLAKKTNELAELSNKLTEISNKLQETESAPYREWLKVQSTLLAFEQYSAMVKPLLNSSCGLITEKNMNLFERITFDIFNMLDNIYKSPVFNMLNQIKFDGENMGFAKTYASPLMVSMTFMHNYKTNVEKMSITEKIQHHNEIGRSIWSTLFDIQEGLSKIKFKNIQHFMDEQIQTNWVIQDEAKHLNGAFLMSPPNSSSVLKELQNILKNRRGPNL